MSLTARNLESYFDRLWPICRSITGKGFTDSLDILEELIPLQRHSWNSGDQTLDWEIPSQWDVQGARIWRESDGETILDFDDNNLHLMGYSEPRSGCLPWRLLRDHVYTVPEMPDAIPYTTSYFSRRYGFCMTYKMYQELEKNPEEKFYFNIQTSLKKGKLFVGDCILQGATNDEIFLSSYLCHPSMAIDNLSGVLVLAGIYQELKDRKLKHTLRFVVNPEQIGMIAYMSRFGDEIKNRMTAGYVVSCVGHSLEYLSISYYYKRSRRGDTIADRAALNVLNDRSWVKDAPFQPSGSDERVLCSPGYNLPVGLIMRKPYWAYPEYHTSADDKSIISFNSMLDMIDAYVEVIETIDKNETYVSTVQKGPPMFSKHPERDIYGSTMKWNAFRTPKDRAMLLNIVNWCDGEHSLLDIAEKCEFKLLNALPLVDELVELGYLEKKQ